MSARDLTTELVGRGVSVRIDGVRRALESDEFDRVGKYRYELAHEAEAEAEPPPKRARARRPADPRPEPAPAANEEVEANEPMLIDRIRALLASASEPLAPAEIAKHLLASGWSTRSGRPSNVITAALSKSSDFERAHGKYRLARGEPASAAEARQPRGRGMRPAVPLGEHVHSIVTRHGSAMTYADILDALAREGWASTSARKRDLLANAVRLHPELDLVLPGVVWIRDANGVGDEHTPPPPVPEPEKPPVVRREPLADPTELAQELAFVRQHIDDARADTAVLAPAYASLQLSAWAARTCSIAERANGHGDFAGDCLAIVRELGGVAKEWSLGRAPPALITTATARDALAAHEKPADGAEPTWEQVADRLDAQLESAYDDAAFDDGWSDTRWLADDERFATEQLDRTEALLSKIDAPFGGPPSLAASFVLGPKELRDLADAARGLRWVRGVVLDGARWGLCMGRLRWLAQKHPAAKVSKLGEVLAPEYTPAAGGWGFDEDASAEKRRWLTSELAVMNGSPLDDWLAQAIECFEDSEIARLLSDRGSALAQLDLRRFESRRVRARIAKLMDSMGVAADNGTPLPDLGDEPPRVPRFPSIRAMLAENFPRRRALMLSNRADDALERRASDAFDLDLEWCLATPRRAALAAETIGAGNHDLVLSASGFHTPSMDASFARAAQEAGLPFVRVNRGRTASCARALARMLNDRAENARGASGDIELLVAARR